MVAIYCIDTSFSFLCCYLLTPLHIHFHYMSALNLIKKKHILKRVREIFTSVKLPALAQFDQWHCINKLLLWQTLLLCDGTATTTKEYCLQLAMVYKMQSVSPSIYTWCNTIAHFSSTNTHTRHLYIYLNSNFVVFFYLEYCAISFLIYVRPHATTQRAQIIIFVCTRRGGRPAVTFREQWDSDFHMDF